MTKICGYDIYCFDYVWVLLDFEILNIIMSQHVSFESKFIKTDVTAIRILRNVVLVGAGAAIHVFQRNCPWRLIYKQEIRNTRGEKIHGFIPFQKNNLLVFGGPFIIIFNVNHDFTYFEELICKGFSDWILDAKLIDEDNKIVAVSMQNKLHILNSNLEILEVIECIEKCILYSAHICYDKYEELIILSGTVFSEILIWRPTRRKNNECVLLARLQKHKGVIFSLHYDEKSGYICSSSDDRSAVLWNIPHKTLSLEVQQDTINILPKCQVYGHLSRIFRCQVLTECFITAGEDSILNVWSLDGKLVKKIETHQGGPIWCLDCDELGNIITGGGDGGVTSFSLNFDVSDEKLALPNSEKPKLVVALSTHNVVVISDSGDLYLYSQKSSCWFKIAEHEDLGSYVVLDVSKCKNMIALAGFNGQIYIYKVTSNSIQYISSYQTSIKSRIISLHWLTCESFLICQDQGKLSLIYLKKESMCQIATFSLPSGIQPCTTTAAIFKDYIVVGDRKGALHLYKFGEKYPFQTMKRVHSHLGVTNLITKNDRLISLGRNSVIKTFALSHTGLLELISSDKLPFTWLLDLFDNIVTAFSSNNFLIWDYQSKRILFEKSCGGGHRSWDLVKSGNSIMFVFVKDKLINKVEFDFSEVMPYDLIEGFHLKEINSIQTLRYLDNYVLVSGGEDTTLRINIANSKNKEFHNSLTLKSHLSSIRSIAIYRIDSKIDNQEVHLIFSAGGRAQIICWKLECFFENGQLTNLVCSEQHSYYKVINSEESEMRFMHLSVADISGNVVLFCACSDGNIKLFTVEQEEKFTMKFLKNLFYGLRCIFLVDTLTILNQKILVTAATDGKLAFWQLNNIFNGDNFKPFHTIQVHQSGINAFAKIALNDNHLLFLTGGDDCAVILNYIGFSYSVEGFLIIEEIDKFIDTGSHWAQITGCFFSPQYFMTASVDQRLLIFKWEVSAEKIICKLVSKYNTSIPDLKGIVCFENGDFNIFLYGKGIEYIFSKIS
ncbi:unnamed protein product [Phaedon cochleariae]|uniref:tRNA (34-2'-O)-methyltransferase regulator WDR6 n=1 Tax=Phaedon cochleariae TaxID=80249 RepID=A0A9P0GVP5_PHACE|nr:unnamed protein product [Phaedon cochleariae]